MLETGNINPGVNPANMGKNPDSSNTRSLGSDGLDVKVLFSLFFNRTFSEEVFQQQLQERKAKPYMNLNNNIDLFIIDIIWC